MQLDLNTFSQFTTLDDLSRAISQIEKQWDVEFKESIFVKTIQAQKEAQSLMDKADRIKEAGDMDYALEVIGMAKALRDASFYHAYKSAAGAHINQAKERYEGAPEKDPYIEQSILAAQAAYKNALEEVEIDNSILSYMRAMILAIDAKKKCEEISLIT